MPILNHGKRKSNTNSTDTIQQTQSRSCTKTVDKHGNKNQLDNNYKTKHPLIQWEHYDSLIIEQKQIGWKQIKYGWFLLKWHEYQQKYETTVYGSTDQGTPKWLGKIVSTIWTFAKTHWLTRCTKNYGTKNSNYSLYRENLIARIQN